MLCDSNILIYATDPGDTRCGAFVRRADAVIASVSRIEVLGFPGFARLSEEMQQRIRALLASVSELELDDRVIQGAIALRQHKKMSLADSIVAATAMVYGVPLVTRNVADFRHIAGLQLVDPFETM